MNPMMKVWLAITLTVLLLISAYGILEHAIQSKPKQIGLIKQVPLTRKANGFTETVIYWSIGPFGKSFPINVYPQSNDQRHIYILTL
jgi:hypothetical protein